MKSWTVRVECTACDLFFPEYSQMGLPKKGWMVIPYPTCPHCGRLLDQVWSSDDVLLPLPWGGEPELRSEPTYDETCEEDMLTELQTQRDEAQEELAETVKRLDELGSLKNYWQDEAMGARSSLAELQHRHDGEQKAKAKAEKEVERLRKENRDLMLDWQKRQDKYEEELAKVRGGGAAGNPHMAEDFAADVTIASLIENGLSLSEQLHGAVLEKLQAEAHADMASLLLDKIHDMTAPYDGGDE